MHRSYTSNETQVSIATLVNYGIIRLELCCVMPKMQNGFLIDLKGIINTSIEAILKAPAVLMVQNPFFASVCLYV